MLITIPSVFKCAQKKRLGFQYQPVNYLTFRPQTMKKIIPLFLMLLYAGTQAISQSVGINYNGATPNAAAALDIDISGLTGIKKGLLIPRMSAASRLTITLSAPAQGLMVYQTNIATSFPSGFYYNNSTTTTPNWIYLYNSGTGQRWDQLLAPTISSVFAHGSKSSSFSFDGVTDVPAFSLSSNSLTTGDLLSLGSTSAATPEATDATVLRIDRNGANNNSTVGTMGIFSAVTNTGIRSANYAARLQASGGSRANYGLFSHSDGDSSVAVYGEDVSLTGGDHYAVKGVKSGGVFTGPGFSNGYAVAGLASGIGNNYGLYGKATGGAVSYGLYANASGGSTNWAGYFNEGNVHVQQGLSIGSEIAPNHGLTVIDSVSGIATFTNSSTQGGEGIRVYSDKMPGQGTAILASGGYLGVSATAGGTGNGSRMGVSAYGGNGTGYNYGINAMASGGTGTYALYADASGAVDNWAGYFNRGNVHIQNRLSIGSMPPNYGLTVADSGITAAYFQNTSTAGAGYGIQVLSSGTGMEVLSGNTGLWSAASGPAAGVDHFGVNASGANGDNNFGVYGFAGGGKSAFGVYGTASGGVANWAGYFAGNVFASGIYQSSDRALKNDIRPLTNSMNIIDQLKPSEYYFKTAAYKGIGLPEGLQYGLIADEVKQVLPGAVKTVVQPALFEKNDQQNGKQIQAELSFAAVNYSMIIPVLVGAVKEQEQTIVSQGEKIVELQQQQQSLTEANNLMKAELEKMKVQLLKLMGVKIKKAPLN
jgi:hypothetical protein